MVVAIFQQMCGMWKCVIFVNKAKKFVEKNKQFATSKQIGIIIKK